MKEYLKESDPLKMSMEKELHSHIFLLLVWIISLYQLLYGISSIDINNKYVHLWTPCAHSTNTHCNGVGTWAHVRITFIARFFKELLYFKFYILIIFALEGQKSPWLYFCGDGWFLFVFPTKSSGGHSTLDIWTYYRNGALSHGDVEISQDYWQKHYGSKYSSWKTAYIAVLSK